MAGSKQGTGTSSASTERATDGRPRASSGRPVWVSPEPSPETVEDLVHRFPKLVRLPEEEVKLETEEWRSKGLVAKSLGRKIPAEAAAREIRLRGGLRGEVSVFSLENGFLLLRFNEEEDRARVLDRPWVVNGNMMAVEPWRPWFVPTAAAIRTAVVWMRLPMLPVELWGKETPKTICEEAGDLVALDESTSQRQRLGFVRAAVRINLLRPLLPGALIGNPAGSRWQRFVYEQLGGICFDCGLFHDVGGDCHGSGDGNSTGLRSENLVESDEPRDSGRQGLGPWLVAVRRWLPATSKVETPARTAHARNPPLTETRRSDKETGGLEGASQGIDGDGGGWTQPSKVARRRSPSRPSSSEETRGAGSRFGPLREGGSMDRATGLERVGQPLVPSPDHTRSLGRVKRARPTAKQAGLGAKEPSPFKSVPVQKGLTLESEAMDVVLERGDPAPEGVNSKGKAPVEMARENKGKFVFSAGGSGAGASRPTEGSSQGPPPMGETQGPTHEEAVDRLRQAIDMDGEESMAMADVVDGVAMEQDGGCHGVDPPSQLEP